MVDESRNWQWNRSHDHGPDDLNKEKLENQTGKQSENSREILQDIPETRNLGSMVMKCLESKRTNRSSGSLDEAQEHSIEIDFGDGKTASRKSFFTEAQAKYPPPGTETTSLPKELAKPDALSHMSLEKQGTLLAQATDKPAVPTELTKPNELTEAHTALTVQRQILEELANKTMKNPQERSRFATDMRNFETNFAQRSQKTEIEKAQEMAATYSQAYRLLNATGDVLSLYPTQCAQKSDETPWRIKAAQEIIHKAAEPFSINQGRLAICPTAALQVRQYYRDPSAPARLVTDVILTGQYTSTTRDKHINLTEAPVNLIPNSDARHYKISDENLKFTDSHGQQVTSSRRSYASQIFDVTATNLILLGKGYRYEQAQDDMKKNYQESKNQGHVINQKDHRITPWDQAIKDKLCVCDGDLSKLNEYITGRHEIGFVISAASLTDGEGKDYQTRKIFDFANRESGINYLYGAAELPKLLLKIEKDGQWPPIVNLDSSKQPILQTNGGSHLLVISAHSEDGNTIAFDNTWGSYRDQIDSTQTPTLQIGLSIRSVRKTETSDMPLIRNLLKFSKEHPSDWEKLKTKWLSFPASLAEIPTNQVQRRFFNENKDPILDQWLFVHPHDHQFRLWQRSLEEWLAKYPEERPRKTK